MMLDRDEVGLAVTPIFAALVGSAGFGVAWPYAALFGALAAYAVALLIAWPLVHLFRKAGLVARWQFTGLGAVIALPFSPLPLFVGGPGSPPIPFAGACIVAGGAVAGILFWHISQRPRNAL